MATDRDLENIVNLVRRLTLDERRQLFARLRLSGLLAVDTLLSDRNRLTVAPALGEQAQRSHPLGENDANSAAKQVPQPPPGSTSATLPLRMAGSKDPNGRRVNGKVVIGVPEGKDSAADPHAMPPLPGQAPERPISIVFDGGSKGNPGIGYGSYALRWPGQPQQIVQLQFGDGVTNNEAEYDTLIAALEAIVKRLRENKADPKTAHVEIRGDSQLVINQVTGEWKCTEERLRNRRDQVRSILREFGTWALTYHARENSVRILGH